MGFSPFQLHLGCSLCILPPLIQTSSTASKELSMEKLLEHVHTDVCKACDNLMATKISQVVQANKYCGKEPSFEVGDFVMLNTANCQRESHKKANGCSTKLMPYFNGRYKVTTAFPEASVYTINIPNAPSPTYHFMHLNFVCTIPTMLTFSL